MQPPRTFIKWVYAGSLAATVGVMVVAVALGVVLEEGSRSPYDYDREPSIAPLIGMLLAAPCMLAWIGSTLFWVYDAWSSVPERHRNVQVVGTMTPLLASLLLLIPCFNIVWGFIVTITLATQLNVALAEAGSSKQVPVVVGVLACCAQLVPYCNTLIAPFLWFGWMFVVDQARQELYTLGDGKQWAAAF